MTSSTRRFSRNCGCLGRWCGVQGDGGRVGGGGGVIGIIGLFMWFGGGGRGL